MLGAVALCVVLMDAIVQGNSGLLERVTKMKGCHFIRMRMRGRNLPQAVLNEKAVVHSILEGEGVLKQILKETGEIGVDSSECIWKRRGEELQARKRDLVIFATARVPVIQKMWGVREEFVNFTLSTIKKQLGPETTEILLVDKQVYNEQYDPGRAKMLGTMFPAVDVVVGNVSGSGEDWRMYQAGLVRTINEWDKYDRITLLNDVMAGPVQNLKQVYEDAFDRLNANMYAGNVWPGCCIRGFFVVFHRRLVMTKSFREYWTRVRFPCGKAGAMYMGEGALGRKEPVNDARWTRCVTSHNYAMGNATSIEFLIGESRSPFMYRKAIERALRREAKRRGDLAATAEDVRRFLEKHQKVFSGTEWCR